MLNYQPCSPSTEQQKLSRHLSIWGAKHYRLFHVSYQVVLAITITYYRVLGRERECLNPAHLIRSAMYQLTFQSQTDGLYMYMYFYDAKGQRAKGPTYTFITIYTLI